MFPITKTTLNSVIAKQLNILESAIAEVQEWAKVLWVRFKSGRPRFVSKKVVEVKKMKELNQNASYSETVDYLKEKNMWIAPDRCSIWGALQLWIHSQKWESFTEESLKKEINEKLSLAGLPCQHRVRSTIDNIVSFKLDVNGVILTFV